MSHYLHIILKMIYFYVIFQSPVSFGGLHKQPDFTTLRLSPLNFLRYNKIPTWEDVQAMIKPLTMNPLSLLPPFPSKPTSNHN